MMKIILKPLFIAGLAISLAACGDKETAPSKEKEAELVKPSLPNYAEQTEPAIPPLQVNFDSSAALLSSNNEA